MVSPDLPAPPVGTRLNVLLQRRAWTRRADLWDHADMPGLEQVVTAVQRQLAGRRLNTVVDLGCGTGRLSLPLASRARTVVAVDLSEPMLARLRERAGEAGFGNVETVLSSLERLDFAPESVSAVVSCYVLHHLRDRDKEALIRRAFDWLEPGGVVAIGDMMLGRGTSTRDRAILRSKVRSLLARGPGGLWRIVKGVVRLGVRWQERPLPPDAWARLLTRVGFDDVTVTPVVAEAAMVVGSRPVPGPEVTPREPSRRS